MKYIGNDIKVEMDKSHINDKQLVITQFDPQNEEDNSEQVRLTQSEVIELVNHLVSAYQLKLSIR